MIRKRQQLKWGGNQQHKPMIRNKQGSQTKKGDKKEMAIINNKKWWWGKGPLLTKKDNQKEVMIANISTRSRKGGD
jgi:hypothetical protein